MATHKHWSAPVQTETAVVDEPTPIAPVAVATPALTYVWVAVHDDDGYKTTRVFATERGCTAWREEIARSRWDGDEEDHPKNDEELADNYFDNASYESFNWERSRIEG